MSNERSYLWKLAPMMHLLCSALEITFWIFPTFRPRINLCDFARCRIYELGSVMINESVDAFSNCHLRLQRINFPLFAGASVSGFWFSNLELIFKFQINFSILNHFSSHCRSLCVGWNARVPRSVPCVGRTGWLTHHGQTSHSIIIDGDRILIVSTF